MRNEPAIILATFYNRLEVANQVGLVGNGIDQTMNITATASPPKWYIHQQPSALEEMATDSTSLGKKNATPQ